MKTTFTYRSLMASIVMILTVAVMNAQDAGNTWHLLAYENDAEVAFYNAEKIVDITATAEDVTIELDNGGKFSHPIETTEFGFDWRPLGSGTGISAITAPKWSVSYEDGTLRFSETVNGVSIYSIAGVLIKQFAGNHTEFPASLNQGSYIIRAGGNSAKLIVTQNGYGGTLAQPVVETQSQPAYAPISNAPAMFRAASSKDTVYWNISAGGVVIPIDITQVKMFRFTSDNSLVIEYHNGNSTEITGYSGGFRIAPEPVINSNWDIEKTLAYGGASYTWYGELTGKSITFAIVHKSGIKFHIEQNITPNQINMKFEVVSPDLWKYDGRLSAFAGGAWDYGMTYLSMSQDNIPVMLLRMPDGELRASTRASEWAFNNNTNIIPTIITQNSDGSVTMNCVDYQGKTISYTFTDW